MLTPTHLNYYRVCQRKCWLFGNGVTMEHTSDTVLEGKLIGEESYPQRAKKYMEVDLGIAKIDFYDPKSRTVHEIKKSDKMEEAHILQVNYYLYLLEKQGVESPCGILEYPKLRKRLDIPVLTPETRAELEKIITETERLLQREVAPVRLKKSFCKKCSYIDLCWANQLL